MSYKHIVSRGGSFFTSKSIPWMLLLVVLAYVVRLMLAWSSLTQLPATSDEASAFLLAETIAHGNRPLLFIGQPYQFPIEAYLLSLVAEWLPHNAFGARGQALLLEAFAVFGFLLIAKTGLPRTTRWPGVLLVLFPSSYYIIYTFGYAPPQYSIAITLVWISAYTALKANQNNKYYYLYAMLAGACCGLGVSNHLLTVSASAGVFTIILWCGSSRKAFWNVTLFCVSALVGSIPYLLAMYTIPGAYENIPNTTPLHQVIPRLEVLLFKTVPAAMGFDFPIYPDFGPRVASPHLLKQIFIYFYITLFSILIIQRCVYFAKSVIQKSWPKLSLVDMALVATTLSIGLATYRYGGSENYRYVLVAVMFFPFLIAHAYQTFPRVGRGVVGAMTIIVVIFNLITYEKVLRDWRNPGEIAQIADTLELEPLLTKLKEMEVTACHASFWLTYRITYESNGEIVCSMPYNERFGQWPTPFKEQVNASTDAVWVMSNTRATRFPAWLFNRRLEGYGFTAERNPVPPFVIFSDFKTPSFPSEYTLNKENGLYLVRNEEGEDLVNVYDGNEESAWVSSIKQRSGQAITVELDIPMNVSGVRISHLPDFFSKPARIKITGCSKKDGKESCSVLMEHPRGQVNSLTFVNNHPIADHSFEVIRFDTALVDSLKVEIIEPRTLGNWGVAELDVLIQDDI